MESRVLSAEDASKDQFFVELGDLAERMIAAHGRDFSMGALILAARFIAEDKPFKRPTADEAIASGEAAGPQERSRR